MPIPLSYVSGKSTVLCQHQIPKVRGMLTQLRQYHFLTSAERRQNYASATFLTSVERSQSYASYASTAFFCYRRISAVECLQHTDCRLLVPWKRLYQNATDSKEEQKKCEQVWPSGKALGW